MFLFASKNPFITAYVQSDWFGKGIFWGLFILSVLSWTIVIHKAWALYQVRKHSLQFRAGLHPKEPLQSQLAKPVKNPFFEIFKDIKQKTLQVISRNHLYSPVADVAFSSADIELIETQAVATMRIQHKLLEKNLFILSTAVTLGPFLGLLGTVWGILITFSELHSRGFSTSNTAMLAGLSMALATTVVGLVIAIPALVGYNYLKNACREYTKDMEDFSQFLLMAVELQYRKPEKGAEHGQKISIGS